jgi:hypothetical protein
VKTSDDLPRVVNIKIDENFNSFLFTTKGPNVNAHNSKRIDNMLALKVVAKGYT